MLVKDRATAWHNGEVSYLALLVPLFTQPYLHKLDFYFTTFTFTGDTRIELRN